MLKTDSFSHWLRIALLVVIATVMLLALPLVVSAGPNNCTSIQDGWLTDTLGNPLSTGYDQFGYNYQAHQFNGTYDGVDRVLDGLYFGA